MTPVPATLPLAAELADPANRREAGTSAPSAADWQAVAQARTRTLDALAGFEKMAEHAEPGFASIVAAYRDLHQRHSDALTLILSESGHPPEDEGSVMGAVNRIVVATRAFFDDIDTDVLAQIHSGEAHVVTTYENAMRADLPSDVQDQISRMLGELDALLADTPPAE